MLNYTTESFLQLRAAAHGAVFIAGHVSAALAECLHGLRKRALALVADAAVPRHMKQHGLHGLVRETWDALATLDEFTNPFALLPRCQTETFARELQWAAYALLALELQQRPVGDQAIFSGHKGVGKTALLQAIGAVSAVLLDKTVPIYWSYENTAADPPADIVSSIPTAGMLLDATASLVLGTAPDMAGALRPIARPRAAVEARGALMATTGKAPLLLVDEFTALYIADTAAPTPAASALRAHASHVLTDLHTLCKRCPNVVALLAASKTQVQRYIHPKASGGFIGYPHFNNTIFARHELPLMRTADEALAYARQRHPGVELPSGEVLVDATGGVARWIGAFVRDPGRVPDVGISEVLASPPLAALFRRILAVADAATLALPGDAPWPVLGIPRSDAARVLSATGMDDDAAADLMEGWCDVMLLTQREDMLEVLRPAMLRAFHCALRDREEAQLQAARVLAELCTATDGAGPSAAAAT
jgi:hypothetical protein